MKYEIICIETEWQITKRKNRSPLNTEPLVKYISEMYDVPYIYRRVATRTELEYYLKFFKRKKHSVLYLSFHGKKHAIILEGEKQELTLEELSEIGGDVFRGRYVHFSSCRTLIGSESVIERFKKQTKAKMVSGYTKSVDSNDSAIHDIALIGELLTKKQLPTLLDSMKKRYGGLEEQLGFRTCY
ncbi:MAG: hypothetical protein J1F29_05710 [Lentimicrobiaceae bacterium]|nr:hypothetical protein [Lentimicrobiaceae bacterium]